MNIFMKDSKHFISLFLDQKLFTLHTKRLVVKLVWRLYTILLHSFLSLGTNYCSSGGKHSFTDVVEENKFIKQALSSFQAKQKHRVVVFRFTDFHVCSVLFVFSLFLYNFLAYLLVLLSLLRLNGDDLLIQVYFLLLFFCSFVTTLHIFFTVFRSVSSTWKWWSTW